MYEVGGRCARGDSFWPGKVGGMSSRLTLLFVGDQSQRYSPFLAEFQSANFQVLIARSIRQAKAILLTRSISVIALCHDGDRDDRKLAAQLKRITPGVPIFLLTNQEQPRPADIDSIWRFEPGDEAVTRGMAVFCRNLFQPDHAFRRAALALSGAKAFSANAGATTRIS
jgi:hypothetical protein